MAGSSPTPPGRFRPSPLVLVVTLTTLLAGLGLWLGGGAGPAAAAGPCELGDLVWHDRNGNSLQDDGEEGVPGIEVTLLDAGEEPVGVDPVLTGADGRYRFDDLACGEYMVRFDATGTRGSFTGTRRGDDPTRDSDPAVRGHDSQVGWTEPILLTEDDPSDLTVDAGVLVSFEECSIGDRIWSDRNGNGVQDDGEPGIPGVAVLLLDPSGEPSGYDPAVSDADGRYSFPEILCGEYTLRFRIPTGAEVTAARQGDDRERDSDITAVDSAPGWAVARAVVGEGDSPQFSDPTVDAGFLLPDEPVPPHCWIGDFVFADDDGDGVQDPGERAGFSALVQLLDDDDQVVTSSFVDSNGKYLLVADCGTYRVRFTEVLEGYGFTRRHAGDDPAEDSDVDPETGLTGPVTVTPGQTYDRTIDAGTRKTGEPPAEDSCVIGGRVWADTDRDGLRSAGEPGVPGVAVRLLDQDLEPVAGVRPVETDGKGRYRFADLACGEYAVRFSGLPEGATFTRADRGRDDGRDSDANADGVTPLIAVGAGRTTEHLTLDAGLRLPAGPPGSRPPGTEPPGTEAPEADPSEADPSGADPSGPGGGGEPPGSDTDVLPETEVLPETGADAAPGWVLAAAAMITAGGLLTGLRRRRRLGRPVRPTVRRSGR